MTSEKDSLGTALQYSTCAALLFKQDVVLEDAVGSNPRLLASSQHACDPMACLSGVHLVTG
jgi:hypothetical protein